MFMRVNFIPANLALATCFALLALCAPCETNAITLSGNGRVIYDGDTTPSPKDGTDFGLTSPGSRHVNKFTIKNDGSLAVTINSINKIDNFPPPIPYAVYTHSFHIGDFETPRTLNPGESCTFDVSFHPWLYEFGKATIRIYYADKSTYHAYNFAVAGECDEILPCIRLLGDDVEVPSTEVLEYQGNEAPPTTLNGTDFGSIFVDDSLTPHEQGQIFVITNTGPDHISIYSGVGALPVRTDNPDFSVVFQPSSTNIAPGETSFFMIAFNPSARGLREANVTFNYNDGWEYDYFDNDTYTFPVQGTGAAPEIDVPGVPNGGNSSFGVVPTSAGVKTKTYTIENPGNTNLVLTGAARVAITGAHAADFTVLAQPDSTIAANGESQFSIVFDPSEAGTRTAAASIANNDLDENPYTFTLEGVGGVQEIAVEGNSYAIECGDLSPRTADLTDFGRVRVDGETEQHSFAIWNIGDDTLDLSGSPRIQIGGRDAEDFEVVFHPDSVIAPHTVDSTGIRFDPSGTGLRAATVSIPNNDSDEDPYIFAIQGTGIMPEMEVRGNKYAIAAGDTAPGVADGTDFGEASAYVDEVSRTFTIHNLGTAELNLSYDPIYIELPSTLWFSCTDLPASPVPPGGSTTFEITYKPRATGVHDQIVKIRNDDSDENPYEFTIRGTCVTPVMRLFGNGQWIPDGATAIQSANYTDFGCVSTIDALTHTFSVENAGSAELLLTGSPIVQTSGPCADQFGVTRQPAASVAAGGASTDFDLRFAPAAGGRMRATVEIASNDPKVGTYTYAVAGWGLQRIIDQEPVSGTIATNAYVFDVNSSKWACVALKPLTGNFDLNVYPDQSFQSGSLGTSSHYLQSLDFVVLNGYRLGAGPHAVKTYGPADGSYIVECETDAPDLDVNEYYDQHAFTADDYADMYDLDLEAGKRYHILVDPADTDIALYLFSPDQESGTSYSCLQSSDAGGNGTFEKLEFNTAHADCYGLLIVDNAGAGGGYSIDIKTGPEIQVSQGVAPGENLIANGDAQPSEEKGTDFGAVSISGFSTVSSFVVENTGVANLHLTNSPPVQFAGENANQFDVIESPDTIIEPHSFTDFKLRFSPDESGFCNAVVNLANNDSDEDPYTFAVRGFASHSLAHDAPKSLTVMPEYANFKGEGWVVVAAAWKGEARDVGLSASSNTDWTGEYATSDVAGSAAEFVARTLPDGDMEHYLLLEGTGGDYAVEAESDWKAVTVGVSREIAMTNLEVLKVYGADLTEGVRYRASIDSQGYLGNLDMSLFILRPNRVCGSRTDCDWSASPAGGEERAEVEFTAPIGGRYVLIVTHESDNMQSCDLMIAEKASEIGPVMGLSGNGVSIAAGSNAPSASDGTDFGLLTPGLGSRSHSFQITNSGDATLDLTGTPPIQIVGGNASDFSVGTVQASYASGASGTFQIDFQPEGAGVRQALIRIPCSDAGRDPYEFAVQGEGVLPEIQSIRITDAGEIEIKWTSISGARYAIGRALNPLHGFTEHPACDLPANPPTNSVSISCGIDRAAIYRIEVESQE